MFHLLEECSINLAFRRICQPYGLHKNAYLRQYCYVLNVLCKLRQVWTLFEGKINTQHFDTLNKHLENIKIQLSLLGLGCKVVTS